MASKKNEIRVINDLELKNVSGGMLYMVGLIVAIILNPPSGNSKS